MPQNPGQEFQYTPKKHGDFMVPPGKWQKYSPFFFLELLLSTTSTKFETKKLVGSKRYLKSPLTKRTVEPQVTTSTTSLARVPHHFL